MIALTEDWLLSMMTTCETSWICENLSSYGEDGPALCISARTQSTLRTTKKGRRFWTAALEFYTCDAQPMNSQTTGGAKRLAEPRARPVGLPRLPIPSRLAVTSTSPHPFRYIIDGAGAAGGSQSGRMMRPHKRVSWPP